MIEIIDLLKPKNGGSFKLLEAIDIDVEGYSSLADAVTHFATDVMIEAINVALSGKASQADLTALEAEVDTKADSSDLTTATANLQAQIDNIVTPVTQDAEVQNARVGADGTSYNTLKARLDAENTSIKEGLSQLYPAENSWIDGKFPTKYGNIGSAEGYSYISIDVSGLKNSKITFTSRYGASANYFFEDEYGNSMEWVGGEDIPLSVYTQTLDIPNLAKSLLIPCLTNSKSTFKYSFDNIINGIKNRISDIYNTIYNTYKSFNTIINKFIGADGKESSLSGYNCSDFILANEGEKYKIKSAFLNGNANIAFYDINKEFVSVAEKTGYEGTLSDATIIVTVPENCKYLRFSFDATKNAKVSCILNNYSNFDKLSDELLPYNKLLSKNISFRIKSGVFIKDDGTEQTLAGYSSSTLTVVGSGTKITLTHAFINSAANIAFYDYNGDFISVAPKTDYSGTLSDATITVSVPNNASYIRWSFNDSYTSNAEYTDGQPTWLGYRPIECDKIESIETKFNINIKNAWNNLIYPVATLVDDDGNSTYLPQLKEICDNLGINCSFAVIYANLQNNESFVETLKTYQGDGFHIMTHPDVNGSEWNPSNPNYDIRNCERHVVNSISYLKSKGFLDCDMLVSPSGYHHTELLNVYKKWCPCSVGYNNNDINWTYERGRYDIRRVFIDSSHNLDFYKSKIDAAYVRKGWIVFGTHSWELGTEGFAELLTSVLEYAISKGLPFKTFNEAWKDRKYIYDIGTIFS